MAQILNEVFGHRELIDSLQKAVISDRLGPFHIFFGPSGVGKKKVAQGLAQVLLCVQNKEQWKHPSACGECASCVKMATKAHEGLLWIEPQGGSIKVEDAREILQFLSLRSWGLRQVVIIDEAHLMNSQTANRLLKSFEEPPENTYFFMLTSSLAAVPQTLRSRAQLHRFGGLHVEDLKKISSVANVKEWMFESAMGSIEKLNSLLDENLTSLRERAAEFWFGFSPENLSTRQSGSASPGSEIWLRWFDFLKEVGPREESLFVVRLWQQYCRDEIRFQLGSEEIIHKDLIPRMGEKRPAVEFLEKMFFCLVEAEREIRSNVDPDLSMTEIAGRLYFAGSALRG